MLLVALAVGVGLCACGSTSSASPAVLTADAAARAAAANPVAVSPEPGTPDASPSTQISFLGTSAHDGGGRARDGLAQRRARGRPARLLDRDRRELPAGAPVRRRRAGDGHRAGDHGRQSRSAARTSFTIAHQAPVSQTEFPINPGDPHAVQHYSTAPSLTPSTVDITTPARPGAAPGDLFLAPYQGEGSPGR